MEPLAIAASCATLGFTVARCIQSITVFVREVRDARGDLDMIARELQSLDTVLACLKDDVAKPSSNTFMAPLRQTSWADQAARGGF